MRCRAGCTKRSGCPFWTRLRRWPPGRRRRNARWRYWSIPTNSSRPHGTVRWFGSRPERGCGRVCSAIELPARPSRSRRPAGTSRSGVGLGRLVCQRARMPASSTKTTVGCDAHTRPWRCTANRRETVAADGCTTGVLRSESGGPARDRPGLPKGPGQRFQECGVVPVAADPCSRMIPAGGTVHSTGASPGIRSGRSHGTGPTRYTIAASLRLRLAQRRHRSRR